MESMKTKFDLTKLTITGKVTDDDFQCFCENNRDVRDTALELDFSNALITGDSFYITDFKRLTSIILPDKFDLRLFYLTGCKCLTQIEIHPDICFIQATTAFCSARKRTN